MDNADGSPREKGEIRDPYDSTIDGINSNLNPRTLDWDWSWTDFVIKEIEFAPGYKLSSQGKLYSSMKQTGRLFGYQPSDDWRELTGRIDRHGYTKFRVPIRGKMKNWSISNLLLTVFIGEAPDSMVACHCDGNPRNNDIRNLRWDTQAGNCADKIKHGTYQGGEKCWKHKLTADQVRQIRFEYESGNYRQIDLVRKYNMSKHAIYLIVTRGSWKYA